MSIAPLTLPGMAILASLASALIALGSGRAPWLMRGLCLPLLTLAGALAALAGVGVLNTGGAALTSLPLGLPGHPWMIALDRLSGLFMLLIGLVVIAVSVYAPGYLREYEHGEDSLPALGFFSGVFIAAMMAVVLAADAFGFMVCWELMSLSSYFLVAFQHQHSANRRAAFLYLLMAHIGGLSILLGYAVLASHGGGLGFEAMRDAALTPAWATLAFALAFLGFGMKAGLVPVHAWLPEAHPVAPSHISALMSGVMLKVAVYGFVRFCFDLLGNIQTSWGVTVLVVGAVSALLGVLLALMQTDLKRMLAYSSVENVGIIFIGLGLSMVFAASGAPTLAALALVAALFHSLNHALFKGLMFLGAGSVIHATHQHNMEQLGGLLRRMPWTGLFVLIGALALSSLPPLNGFASEWLTFQAALQAWSLHNGLLRSLIPITAAMLALTGALAAACFVRAYGISFLGLARGKSARKARETGWGMRAALGLLAVLCLLLGVLPTPVIQWIEGIPRELLGTGLPHATQHGWLWLTPVSPATASYAPLWLALGLALAWGLTALLLRRGAVRKITRGNAWDCGFGTRNARTQYTATAFSQPFGRVFGMLFQVDAGLREDEGGGTPRYLSQVSDHFWGWLYAPVARATLLGGRLASHLQSGHLRHYLGWTLATLLLLLWMIS